MKSRKLTALLLVFVLLGTVATMACTDDDDDDDDNDVKVTFNGTEYTLKELFEKLTAKTITGSNDQEYTGFSLSDAVNETGLASPGNYQYNIAAADGYNRNVTWADMQMGVLVEEDTMSAFPHLPGKYRIKDVVEIKKVETETIEVCGWLYTWEQPFHKFDEVEKTVDEETYTGVVISDVINDTGLENPENYNFNISASDYSKEVSWNDTMNGILVLDEYKNIFPEKEKKYWIKNIVKIETVEI